MHTKCPECNLEFTPESHEDEIKILRAENARYRKASEFYTDKTNYSYYCYEVSPKTFGDDELGSHARKALRGE